MSALLQTDISRVISALAYVPSDERELWCKMGMAIKSEFAGEEGFAIWSDWSQSGNYIEADAKAVWKSFDAAGGIGFGSLFYEAKTRGWVYAGESVSITSTEIAKKRAERAIAELAHKKNELLKHQLASTKSKEIYAYASAIEGTNPYLVKKGINAHVGFKLYKGSLIIDGRAADGALIVPIGDQNAISGLEFIWPDGVKRPFPGADYKGKYFCFGSEPVELLNICEGISTGASIFEATNVPTFCARSRTNLKNVAIELRRRYPQCAIRICSDAGNGEQDANKAAHAVGGSVVVPIFNAVEGSFSDFNDLHQAQGLESVRLQLTVKRGALRNEVTPFIQPKLPLCDARDGTHTNRSLSESGNAERLFDAHGEWLRYIHDAKPWLVWNGSSWRWDCGAAIRALAIALPEKIYAEGIGDMANALYFVKWGRKSREKRTIDASVALLADRPGIRLSREKIDADPFIIGFNHSTQIINLQDGTIRSAETNDYVTKSLNVATVGNPNKAVRWIQFLHQVFSGDEELIYWIQMFCGYLLTGSTEEHIFLFCFGQGANGKSVFIEILKFILGDYSRAIASETLSESKRQAGGATPDLAALVGARLVICSETEDNTALSESLLKGLVSGDSMSVRPLYSAPIQLTPSFKLIMAGNHKPVIKGVDNGIWRRVRLVPFNRTFSPEERDPHLAAKLRAEAPHILAWMVEGCVNWQTHRLSKIPQTIRQATEEYRVDQDIIGTWLDECTSFDSKESVVTAVLYQNYKTWCIKNGHMAFSKTALGRRLTERGFNADKVSGNRCWLGLRLIDQLQGCSVQAYVDRKGR